MTYFSAFSGIGGFEMGIQQAYESDIQRKHLGAESQSEERRQGRVGAAHLDDQVLRPADRSAPLCIGYSEIDKYAIKIYEHHFPNHKNYGDITEIDTAGLPDFELLCGGFPCQSFSIAGKRGGFEDTRGTLFFHLARLAKDKRPRLLFFENVRGLLSHDGGRTYNTIVATLTELGYDLQWQVLNSKDFGVPQNRERVFIIGHIRGTPRPQVFPFGEDGRTPDELSRHVENTITNTITARYEGAQATGTYIAEGELDAQEAGEQGLLEERAVADHPDGRRGQAHTAGIRTVGLLKEEHREKGNYLPRERVISTEGASRAISTHESQMPYYQDNMNIRRLTPTECARLQGFPDDWHKIEGISDTQAYRAYGNAVTVNVIREIVKRLIP